MTPLSLAHLQLLILCLIPLPLFCHLLWSLPGQDQLPLSQFPPELNLDLLTHPHCQLVVHVLISHLPGITACKQHLGVGAPIMRR